MGRYVYHPGTQTYIGLSNCELIEVPDHIKDADEIEDYLLSASADNDCEDLEAMIDGFDARVTELLRYNSGQVVQRRVAHAKLRIAEDALANIANISSEEWARKRAMNAAEKIAAINPDDYGRP